MGHTHTLAEWVAYLSLGLVPVGVIGFAVAFAETDAGYFDPRPALLAAWDRLLVESVRARHAMRAAALTAAALLLILAAPNGATS
jgi:hypothetical protein